MRKLILSTIIGVFLSLNFMAPVQAGVSNAAISPQALTTFAQTENSGQDFDNSSCEGGSLMGWMLCWTVRGLYTGINFFYDRIILPGLQIDPLSNSNDPTSPERYVFVVWESFRTLATILFIMIFMLAIIGQSFSWFFTPYELKKILPRLFIGAIAIQISFYMVGFVIDFFNVLGAGIGSLILSGGEGVSFNLDLGYSTPFNGKADNPWAILGDVLGVTAAGGTAFAVSQYFGTKGIVMGLNLILLPVLLLVVVITLIIAVRKIVVLTLVVLSPVAFALWILPGTQEMFKRWWELLWKTLLMYPLIVALIAGGKLTSRLVNDLGIFGGLEIMIGIAALFAPYVLIPSTFKFAGSVLSAVGNGANGASKGLQNRIFGDPHSEFSYRGRMHHALSARRMDNKIDRVKRSEPVLSKIGQASRAAGEQATYFKGRNKLSRAGQFVERKGRKAGAGTGAAAKSMLKNPFQTMGALATGAQLRVGPGVTQAMAERNKHRLETISNLGGYDSEILIGILGGSKDVINPITGKQIGDVAAIGALGGSANLFGDEPLFEDRAAVQGAMLALSGRLSTAPQLEAAREMLMNNPHIKHMGDHVAEDIWEVFKVHDAVTQIAPEMRFKRLDGSYEFEPPAGQSGFRTQEDKDAARAAAIEMTERFNSRMVVNGHLAQARAGVWDGMSKLDQALSDFQLTEPTSPDLVQARDRFAKISGKVEEAVMDDAYQAQFDPRHRDLLVTENNQTHPDIRLVQEIVTDENGKIFMRDKFTSQGRPVYDMSDPHTAETLYKIPSNRTTAEAGEARIGRVIEQQIKQKEEHFGNYTKDQVEEAIRNSNDLLKAARTGTPTEDFPDPEKALKDLKLARQSTGARTMGGARGKNKLRYLNLDADSGTDRVHLTQRATPRADRDTSHYDIGVSSDHGH